MNSLEPMLVALADAGYEVKIRRRVLGEFHLTLVDRRGDEWWSEGDSLADLINDACAECGVELENM